MSFATANAQTTTFTGKVYSPAGPATGDPIPNILVFIQDTVNPDGALPVFTQGITIPASGPNSCDAQPNLVPKTVLGEALTGPDGSYTFSIAAMALPNPLNVVIQAGKWRRLTSMDSSKLILGGTNTLPDFSMPSAQGPGADLPHIAVVTGAADEIECIFRQIGINDSEITDPNAPTPGSINLFLGTTGGQTVSSSSPTEKQLLEPASTSDAIPLTNYDLVMFGCQGTGTDDIAKSYAENLVPYANVGGRIFATHFGYVWLEDTTEWAPLATWNDNSSYSGNDVESTIDTTYDGGLIISSWLNDIGALEATNPPQISLDNVRESSIGLPRKPAQSWGVIAASPTHSIQFSFDTPIGASGVPSVAVSYTNNQTQFLQDDPNDSIMLKVTNTSTNPTTQGLTMTITVPSNLTVAAPPVDSSGGNWGCSGTSPTITCILPVALAAGASDAVTLTFSIPQNAALGQVSLTAALAGGGISNSGQCGRVLFNDYHVEEPPTDIFRSGVIPPGTPYGTGASAGSNCPKLTSNPDGKLTSAQKFLEYSLYNLSNFVSPSTTDLLLIQGAAKLAWDLPSNTTLYYGAPLSTVETASSVITGSFAYTTDSNTLPLEVGTHVLTATFTPSDPDYIGGSLTRQITILQDPTISAVNATVISPLFYGQKLTYAGNLTVPLSITVQNPPGYTVPVTGGTFTVMVDGIFACSGTVMGNAACLPASSTFDAGTHRLSLGYGGTLDFGASTSTSQPFLISPDPTNTTMTSSATISVNLQPLTFTAAVADQYTAAIGPVTFYDSTTTASPAGTVPVGLPIGTAALDTTGHASLTSTTVFTGTHNISACFTPVLNSLNTYNYLASCSASVQVVVTTSATTNPAATSTILTSSANPSTVGQVVSFTASVSTSGPFPMIPSGTVKFFDGATFLDTATLDSTGSAFYTTTSLTAGSHPITAVYSGTATLGVSTSGVLTQVVNTPLGSAGTGFMAVFDTTGVQVPIGSSGFVQIRIIELNNFNQPVKLACTGLPAEAACLFATDLIPATGGTTQLSVSAAAPHGCNSKTPYFVTPAALPLLGLASLMLLFVRRRKLQAIALLALLTLLPAILTGCGGGNCTDFGVKPNTYNFTITATSQGSPVVVKVQNMTMNAHL